MMLVTQLYLSEIMYNPNGSESHNEFVEIYNANEHDSVSLDGFSISDGTATDLLEYFQGLTKIPPCSYGLIMDRSYFGNSTFYDTVLPSNIAIYLPMDNSIGSAGLSNSTAETIYLYSPEMALVDSVTYELASDGGFSYERRHHFGGDWRLAIVENGTIGRINSVDQFIESVQGNVQFLADGHNLTIFLKNESHEFRQLHAQVNVGFFRLSGDQFVEAKAFSITHVKMLNGRENQSYSVALPEVPTGFYNLAIQLNIDATEVFADTVSLVKSADQFPLLVTYLYLERPQVIELTNTASFDVFIDTLGIRGNGSEKTIKLVRQLAAGESLRLSKHDISVADIFNEDIPFLYSKNGALRLRFENMCDSLEYHVDELAFANQAISLIPKKRRAYNWQSQWQVNAQQNQHHSEETKSFRLEISPNPFSPNNDGIEDMCEIKLNYNEYDLISLTVYSMYGRHIKDISPLTYQGIGTWVWDGANNQGEKQKEGLYVLLFNGKSKRSGREIIKKYVLVLAQ